MPFSAPTIMLLPEVRAILEPLSRSRAESRALVERSTVILRAAEGASYQSIATELGVTTVIVGIWRRRWVAESPRLVLNPQHGPSLDQQIRRLLADRPGRGRKDIFSAEQVAGIVTLAPRKPRDIGVEADAWTHELLAKAAIQQEIVPSISPSRVGVFLKRGRPQTARRPRLAQSHD